MGTKQNEAMNSIKFGTDGWRAVIAKDYTVDNVARVTVGVARWLKDEFPGQDLRVVLGHDCRFGGELFVNTVARVLLDHDIGVLKARNFASTPMVSYGTLHYGAHMGIILTASHNPPEYHGYKLRGHYGGPLLPEKVDRVAKRIPDEHGMDLVDVTPNGIGSGGDLEVVDLETLYIERLKEEFDIDSLVKSDLVLAYNGMYGAGQNVVKRLLPDAYCNHCYQNPSFKGIPPEPIHRNLRQFSTMIREEKEIDSGLATDGDGDRLGMYDGQGRFVDSNNLILLAVHYLVKHKGMKGKVVTAFSTSVRIRRLCEHYGIEHQQVKIGFKHICEIMLEEDVLLGGEESGGIAIKGHIPERDGLWVGFMIWEYMLKTGKPLRSLIEEVQDIVGPFYFERVDLHLNEPLKQRVMEKCEKGGFSHFGEFEVQRVEDMDGYKFFFNEEEWVMIRPSGTEPVLRTYAEGNDRKRARAFLEACRSSIMELED